MPQAHPTCSPPPFEQRAQSASTRQLLSGLLQTLPSPTGKPPTRPLRTRGDSLGLSVRPHPRGDTIRLPGRFPPPSDGAFRSLHFVQPPLAPRPPPSPKPRQCPRTLSPFFELQCSLPLSLGITERAAAGVMVPPDPPLTRLCARPSAGQWLRRARPACPFQCSQLSHGVSGSQGPGLWQLNADSCPPCLQLWSRRHRCVPRAQAGALWEPEAVV